MKMKKARSTAAILAVMALTAGFNGASVSANMGAFSEGAWLGNTSITNNEGIVMNKVTENEDGSTITEEVFKVDTDGNVEGKDASYDSLVVGGEGGHLQVGKDGAIYTNSVGYIDGVTLQDGNVLANTINGTTIDGTLIKGEVGMIGNTVISENEGITVNKVTSAEDGSTVTEEVFNVDKNGHVHAQGDIVSSATVSGKYLFTNDGKFSAVDGKITGESADIKGDIDADGAIHAQGDIVSNATVSGEYLYTNDGKFSVVDGKITGESANIKGDLNVGGNLTVNGTTITGEDLVGSVADVSTIKDKVGFDTTTNTYKEITVTDAQGNAVTNLTDAVNTVDSRVGNGVLSNTNASNLTEAVNQNYAQINNNTQAISALDSRVDDLGGEIDQVGAISAALAGLHPLDYDGTGSKFQLSAAMGSYDSTQAAAIGAFYHFNRDVMISLGGATSFDGDHKTAGNLGVTFRVGAGASGKAVSDDVMARLEAMDQKIAALEQENKDLKNVLGAIDTSLSKEFPDVPANHWAYEAVTKLAGNDVVAGYPDGEFHGDRTMTRYEMAEIIYKAMNRGVQVDQKLVNEFKPEMEQVAANQNA